MFGLVHPNTPRGLLEADRGMRYLITKLLQRTFENMQRCCREYPIVTRLSLVYLTRCEPTMPTVAQFLWAIHSRDTRVKTSYSGHEILFSKAQCNRLTMWYHIPLSDAKSPRGVSGTIASPVCRGSSYCPMSHPR